MLLLQPFKAKTLEQKRLDDMASKFQTGDFLYKKSEFPVNTLYSVISTSDNFIVVHDNNSYANFQIKESDFSKFGKISWIGLGPRNLIRLVGAKITDAKSRIVHSVLAAENGKVIIASKVRKFLLFDGWKFKSVDKDELFSRFRISYGIIEIPIGFPIGENGKAIKLKNFKNW